MAEQLNLDFTSGENPGSQDGRDARRRAWVKANRVERAPATAPTAETDDLGEDLLDVAARSGSGHGEGGFEKWQAEQKERNESFARRLGLPLGHHVEVVLGNGTILRGRLSLGSQDKRTSAPRSRPAAARATRTLLPLLVGRTPVTAGEIASCVRIDDPPPPNPVPPHPKPQS